MEPFTTPDLDLRDFPYMPLDVLRLRDSETAILCTGDEFRAAVLLWCAAWHQVPAASLPNDDRLLASLAGCGRDRKLWTTIREGALRGFVECDDGRLYHPVIAEKAIEAESKRRTQSARTKAATEARRRQNDRRDETRDDKRHGARVDQRNDQRDDDRDDSRNVVQEKGREGKRREEEYSKASTASGTAREGPTDEAGWLRVQVVQAYEAANVPFTPDTAHAEVLVSQGFNAKLCAAVIREGIAKNPTVRSLKYFDGAIREAHEKRPKNGSGGTDPPKKITDKRHAELSVKIWREGKWPSTWGPEPDQPGCRIVPELLTQLGIIPAEAEKANA
jgi:hypothetical protein